MKKNSNQSADDRPHLVSLITTTEVVALPGLVVPLIASEGVVLEAVDYALEHGRMIALAVVNDEASSKSITFDSDHINKLAVWAKIVSCLETDGGEKRIRLQVEGRLEISKLSEDQSLLLAEVNYLDSFADIKLKKPDQNLIREVREEFAALAEIDGRVDDYLFATESADRPGELADLVASALELKKSDSIKVLEEFDGIKRLKLVSRLLAKRLDANSVGRRIARRAARELSQVEKEEVLREQIDLLRAELGEDSGASGDLEDLERRLLAAKLPKVAREEADKQFRRLKQVHPDTSEAGLMRTYLECILDLPWSKKTRDKLDLANAKKILDEDHFGLEKPKERILDYLGVRKLKNNNRGPVLLLVGPPGVGKTSLGKSIAKALGRKFVRVSVGGLRDEAELRGHRRTYVGSLPGRIIQGLRRAKSRNPVFMLDELDKIGSDFRGDPASVLLEVLDPVQNKLFEDHYLNIPFDLSEVIFIATANLLDPIPEPLRDRMEVIEVAGYTDLEKVEICKRYLLDRAAAQTGLEGKDIAYSEAAITELIRGYTRESGIRELSRVVQSVYRKIARYIAEGKKIPKTIDSAFVEKALGKKVYKPEQRQLSDEVGVVTGLAWTSVGGETLMIEASVMPGKGTLLLTGQQGEVMQESARAALTFVNSNASKFGIDSGVFEDVKIHIHLPQGAIPKDGPSAGIGIATAIVSILTDIPVSHKVAMTGEITLRGNVLGIGGLKEKALAALRVGISTVIIPSENSDEISELPQHLRDAVEFVPVSSAFEVVEKALIEVPKTLSMRGDVAVDGKAEPLTSSKTSRSSLGVGKTPGKPKRRKK